MTRTLSVWWDAVVVGTLQVAEDLGLAASFIRRRVRELSDAVTAQVLPIAASTPLAALDASALKEYAALIATRAERIARTITT